LREQCNESKGDLGKEKDRERERERERQISTEKKEENEGSLRELRRLKGFLGRIKGAMGSDRKYER
jgi:hypothetical protein